MAVLATSSKLIRRTIMRAMKCVVTIAIIYLTGKLHNNKSHDFDNISMYLLLWSLKLKSLLIVEFWREPQRSLRLLSDLIFTSIGYQGFRWENELATINYMINEYVCVEYVQ